MLKKHEILRKTPKVETFFLKHPSLKNLLKGLTIEQEIAFLSMVEINQGEALRAGWEKVLDHKKWIEFLDLLVSLDRFYEAIGGLIGYHELFNELRDERKESSHLNQSLCHYHKPEGIDLSESSKEVQQLVLMGIEGLKDLVQIFPVGGAGDRLMLKDETTGQLLPAACLQFTGRSLLEGLMRDLQAIEYLYYKIYGKQILIPVVMMTSFEKKNHSLIQKICENLNWFFRPKEAFHFLIQPLAPVITNEGHWCFGGPLEPVLKPGGHGILWKMAIEEGVFQKLHKQGKKKALLRQINNPMASVDYGLLGFLGVGFSGNHSFGFASCERRLFTSEGVVVQIETQINTDFEKVVTNIEYTDFIYRGIEDAPKASGSPYSKFPSNTNILFADLQAIKDAVKVNPFPGMIVNMKTEAPWMDEQGGLHMSQAGRLETTMQNIADSMNYKSKERHHPADWKHLPVYVTYNTRQKTISVTKRCYSAGKPLEETPEGCFYELLKNHRDLFSKNCGVKMPKMPSVEDYLNKGPSFVIDFHPALGPLYSIIAQKIRGGKIEEGSELQIEASEVDIEGLELSGSLLIRSNAVMGHLDSGGMLEYSESGSKCELINVKVNNHGILRTHVKDWWKLGYPRKECFEIVLHGDAEFSARDLMIEGPLRVEVPAGHRMVARLVNGELTYELTQIKCPSWHWKYQISSDASVCLKKVLINNG